MNFPSLISGAASTAPSIISFASPDNAAIVTNTGLIEIDPGRTRVDELAYRLDHALRKRKVLNHIAPAIEFMEPGGCGITCWRTVHRVDCIGSSD